MYFIRSILANCRIENNVLQFHLIRVSQCHVFEGAA